MIDNKYNDPFSDESLCEAEESGQHSMELGMVLYSNIFFNIFIFMYVHCTVCMYGVTLIMFLQTNILQL